MKNATWLVLALCGLASAVSARGTSDSQQRQPRFAILNLPDSTCLQMEVDSLDGTQRPKIDSMKVEYSGTFMVDNSIALAKANVRVWWSIDPMVVLNPAVHVVQITKALPVSKNAPVWGSDTLRTLRVDTVFVTGKGWTESVKVVAPPHVDNTNLPQKRLFCKDYMCLLEDSTTRRNRLVSEFANAWRSSRYGVVLEPTQIMTLVYVSPWSMTTGLEDVPGIVVPMIGNRGNWIDVQTQRFDVRKSLLQTESVPAPKGYYKIPTGFVRYAYNRAATPELEMQKGFESTQIDSILKVGGTLWVEGSSRSLDCDIPSNDTTMHSSSWLVLAASSNDSDMRKSMAPAIRGCGLLGRSSAWNVSNDTVWLESTPFRIDELVALAKGTSVAPKGVGLSRSSARVSRTKSGLAIDLPASAKVSITNLSGQVVMAARSLEAGRHELSVNATRGLVLVHLEQAGRNSSISCVR